MDGVDHTVVGYNTYPRESIRRSRGGLHSKVMTYVGLLRECKSLDWDALLRPCDPTGVYDIVTM
jgi:hypothetical protein